MLALIDLETVPAGAQFGAPAVVPDSVKMPDPPGSYKRQESIDRWRREHGPAARRELWRRWALDPLRATVAAAAWYPPAGPVCVVEHDAGDPPWGVVERLALAMRDAGIRCVAHWGSFDRGMLRGQIAQHGDRMHPDAVTYLRAITEVTSHAGRPWFVRAADLSVWSSRRLHGARSGWGLDATASALGLTGKTGTPSAGVLEAWEAGDAAGIADRAKEDVLLTIHVAARDGIWPLVEDWASRVPSW